MMSFLESNNLIVFVLQEWKILAIFTIIFLLYFHYTSTFTFFENKGIPFMKPTLILGNLGPRLMLRVSVHNFELIIYNYFKGKPFGGMFEGRRPNLVLFDPELIKAVAIRDFDHFVDRNSLKSREPRYLSRSLLNLKGQEWKGVRSILTPTFSSARLRIMVPLMQQCCIQMVDFLKKFDKQDIEMKDTIGHYTLEVFGACAFGIKCDALTDENAHFIQVAKNFAFMSTPKRLLIFFVLLFMPKMFQYLNISFLNFESTEELVRMLNRTKAERRASNIKGNDFLQLLIDASEKEQSESEKGNNKRYLDEDTMDAQSLLFLIAGYETSSSLLSFAVHVLATHTELQNKLRTHVEEITNGKELHYDILKQLEYLDAFLMETLRMYPPLARVDRIVTKKYNLPGTNVTLDPGDKVSIPIYGIHMDPAIYPEPQEFRPERFLGDEKKNRPSHLYMPFGIGPRNCIGMRFAMVSAKLAMVALLKNFKFSACSKTVDPIVHEKKGILLKARGGLWVTIEALS